mmetsp:Transcript_33385/g.87559  ORF Transcript_33385/g.87559 Transcript_33385/m.87559 type:complete len:699 (+) Transcript_33385:304-2400(+)|eukprot:CAMPEP_0182932064 /NCGR_PEP_ID=MMETSP0105_2-20130417/30285_1 /TAXON_ID=81532 ORGANISM="Acanthoeca-like sp., Strain 10tr" /NCGR_SAMPLE_ID=MMETSP0105_2 /ASSEMBLY_ACC=CAM_ASM_000205 /LENGTH=698 /DNA_ID=CAMNT_0025070611 /DNA_START=217 /DNA_END=2313 /DNA_ORIENTATION=+
MDDGDNGDRTPVPDNHDTEDGEEPHDPLAVAWSPEVVKFCLVTGKAEDEAQQFVDMAGGNLNGALELYFDVHGGQAKMTMEEAEEAAMAAASPYVVAAEPGAADDGAAAVEPLTVRPAKKTRKDAQGERDNADVEHMQSNSQLSVEDEVQRTVSQVSNFSNFSVDSASEFEFEDGDDAFDNFDSPAASGGKFHTIVQAAAMEANQEVYDCGLVVDVRSRGIDSAVVVEISTGSLEPQMALAWEVDTTRTINVAIVLDHPLQDVRGDISELSKAEIKVEALGQPDTKKQMKVAHQLVKITEFFCVAFGEDTPDIRTNYRTWAEQHPLRAKSKNFFVRLISYVSFRLSTLHAHCTICDQRQRDTLAMLLPSVCCRTLCMYSWQTFAKLRLLDPCGGGRSQLHKLLRSFFVVASLSSRYAAILTPWPKVFKGDGGVLIDDKTPIDTIQKIAGEKMDEFPKVPCADCTMSKKKGENTTLADTKCMLCGLESWILSSNRSMVVHIPPDFQFSGLETSQQFLLLSNPPELEQKFQEHKKEFGSQFFFHGSPTENWHSIMRSGFFVASGEKRSMRLHGAAHGDGVYVAQQLATSFGYCSLMAKGGAVPEPFRLLCVAICEVVSSKKVKDCGWCKVVPEAELIVPRFLIVWNGIGKGDFPNGAGPINSTDKKFDTWCRDRVRFQGLGFQVDADKEVGEADAAPAAK